MDNLLLAFSDVQIRPKVGFAPAAVIRKSDVMERRLSAVSSTADNHPGET
jgi:hypothetical protein